MFEGMDTSGYGGFVATQGNTERRSSSRPKNSPWLPVVAKDIHDLLPGQDAVRRGIHESSEVTLVGIILSADRKAAMIEYLLDDNSGPPLVVNHVIEDERQSMILPVPEKKYVRVIGKVRTWGNQRCLTAFAVRPLKNLNELSMHMLEITYSKMFYQKDMIRQHEDQAQKKMLYGGSVGATAPVITQSKGGLANLPAPSRNAAASSTVSSGLIGFNGEIHKFLGTASTESGYSVQDVHKRFPNLGLQKVRETLELLASEGHVYTTIDDEHFRTTDA